MGYRPKSWLTKLTLAIAMLKANPQTNSNKDIPREKQQTQDNESESLKSLIAQIEQERDYFHTCINSQY